jgi:hypothetical protein
MCTRFQFHYTWYHVLSAGVMLSGRETKIHLHLAPRLRINGDIPPLPPYVCQRCASVITRGQLQCLSHQIKVLERAGTLRFIAANNKSLRLDMVLR